MTRSANRCARRCACLTVLVGLCLTAMAQADEPKKPKPRFTPISEVTKGMQSEDGLFTVYRVATSDKNRDPEKLLCKIPKAFLKEDLLFATSISSGGSFTSWMWRDNLIRFEIVGKQLRIVTPETRYVQKKNDPVSDVVERTYRDRYIAVVPIVAMTNHGDPVIDLEKLLKSDLAGVSFLGGRVRPELSTWNKVKIFPNNVLIDVDLALGTADSGQTVGVAYSFRRLPKLGGYSPREADDRIGYFLTAHVDWSKDPGARDTFDRYINRWQLEKRDPKLALSPPKKPITFIIEKTVPIQWRRWVRQGILDWNKAFEAIGYTDAIVVQQQTDDNEYADYDPEDARYNFFRWIVSGRAFAMGPSRTDPRTGEILDADIIMDDSFVRAWMGDFDIFAPAAVAELKGPGFALWAEQNPDLTRAFLFPNLKEMPDLNDAMLATAQAELGDHGQHVCTYATGFSQEMALLHHAMIATGSGKKIPEHFIGQAIREVVTHEVGHTLGLRHNFKASSWLTLEEIKRRRDNTDEATSASIMDYNPLLFFKGDEPENVRHFVTPTIGPYDHWAIEYGYGDPGKDQNEAKYLAAVAQRCAEPGLDYLTDEDTRGVYSCDPSTNTYDMGVDPAEWAQSRLELVDELTENINDWAFKEGDPRYHARSAFRTLWFQKARNYEYLARLVGGQYFHRDHVGDPDARPAFVIVPAEKQRAALKKLSETVFKDEFFACDAEVLNQLAPSRWSHYRARPAMRLDFPIHEYILQLQNWSLFEITNPQVLQRIYDAELKCDDADKFTAAECIQTVRDAIFAQLDSKPGKDVSDATPYISSTARNLQRSYLDLMLNYARYRPGALMASDLTSMLRFSLRELSEKIGGALDGKGRVDFATRAHLTECKSRIDRMLEARFTEN